jgi:hypothetical protein
VVLIKWQHDAAHRIALRHGNARRMNQKCQAGRLRCGHIETRASTRTGTNYCHIVARMLQILRQDAHIRSKSDIVLASHSRAQQIKRSVAGACGRNDRIISGDNRIRHMDILRRAYSSQTDGRADQ